MGKIVRAILIDPFKCSVTVVDHDCSELKYIHAAISHDTMRVSVFDVIYPGSPFRGDDAIFYDADGLMKPCDRFFKVLGGPPIAGKAIVLGAMVLGELSDCESDLAAIRRGTVFFERIEGLGLVRTFTPWHPHHLLTG